ncbi:MAG TPA: hypothetical protein VGC88_09505 [Terriglobales bacterium]|jgi:hypothetical protein
MSEVNRRDPRWVEQPLENRSLNVEEIRLVGDLRYMHNRVLELIALVREIRERHPTTDVVRYADRPLLELDIQRVDEAYQYYLDIRQELDKQRLRSA